MKWIVAFVCSMGLMTFAPAAQAAPGCQFQLGFAVVAKLIPDHVGGCVDSASYNGNTGDALQHTTTGGLLVWRKADNWTAFTDGYHTWVNGPYGLQERLNSAHFPWEAPTPANSTTAGAGPTPANGSSVGTAPTSQGGDVTEADVAVPDGYPPMSDLPPDEQAACLHLAQDLQKASGGTAVHMQTDDQSCPYFADPNWQGVVS